MTDTTRISPARTARTLGALVATTGLVMTGAVLSPATAATDQARDRVGDADSPPGARPMDISSVTVRNRDRSVLVITRFAQKAKGSLIVSIDPRRGAGVRMISTHRPNGQDRDRLLPFAFVRSDDMDPADEEAADTTCPRFRVSWSDDDRVARMVLPSRCLADGNYGAIQYSVLTEVGADSDIAHYGPRAENDYVPRG